MSLANDLELIRRAVELIRSLGSGTISATGAGPLSPAWANLLEAVANGADAFTAAKGDTTEEMYRWSPAVARAVKVAELVVSLLDPYEPDVGPIPDAVWDAAVEADEPVDLDAIADPDGVVVRFRARR